jgi:hypothetical protein
MDDCFGRLVAILGVDRTATEKAVRIVERWPSAAPPVRCARKSWNHSAGPLRTNRGKQIRFEFGSICVGFNVTTAGNRRTASVRLPGAAAAVTGEANGHSRERERESAAGEIAGAILVRSQQI